MPEFIAQLKAASAENFQSEPVWPMVSVVIPVKNDAARLDTCLRSLQHQNYPSGKYEIIVVDNGSTDGSAQVAVRYGCKTICFPGLSVGALRNRGVEQATGEILAFVDADHEVPTAWIKSAAAELREHDDLCMVGSPCLAPPQGTWVQKTWQEHRLRKRGRQHVQWLGAGNMFVRRRDFDRIGGFRESLIAAEDVDLCVRLAQHSAQILSDPSLANIHHGEPRTLRQFFWKEYWRGSSGLLAFFSHGMPLHELPSLIYPTYYLVATLGFITAAVVAVWQRSLLGLMLAAIAIVLPALLMAIKTGWQTRRPTAVLPLAMLYLAYGFSRAAALFKP